MEDRTKRILIIEDDRFISEMYARTLRKEGYVVEETMTGPEGLTKAKGGGWYLILLDIMLPDKTGVEVIEELRASENKDVSGTKIIIITNFEQDDATRQALEKLADGYLIKAEITPRRMAEIIRDMSAEDTSIQPLAETKPELEPEPDKEQPKETAPEVVAEPTSAVEDTPEE